MRFMRLSRTAWLILGIGIFAIALGSLYTVYLQQKGAQDELNTNLETAEGTLSDTTLIKEGLESQLTNLESELTQLESELTQAISSLNSAKGRFPESVESIEYDELLFNFAHGYNLRITELIASEPGNEEVEEAITYSVTPFTVDVKGEVAGILDFINAIVTSEDFTCATAELVNINIPEPLTEAEKEAIKEGLTAEIIEGLAEEELTEEEREDLLWALTEALVEAEKEIEELEMPSASIRLVIYGYKGE